MRFFMLARINFFCFIFFAAVSAVDAQFIGNGAILHLDRDAEITTDLAFTSNGFIENEGTIRLLSDWKNGGIYQGAGALVLNGTTLQNFAHNGISVVDVSIINPSGILLNGKLPISGRLDLNEGLFITSLTDTLLIETGGSISGGSPLSFVEGPLHRGGRGEMFFPVGTANTYLPVTFTNVSGGNTITVLQAKSNFTGSMPQNISSISRDFYWERTNYRDVFTGSQLILPLFDTNLERANTVVLGLENTEFTIYEDLTFSSGDYYTEAFTESPVTESTFLLASLEQSVRDETAFYVPNALSLSATDPENRVIKVFGDLQDEDFSFVIYDRRGIEVFSSNSRERIQNVGWNGTSFRTGEILPAGTYVYAVNARNTNGESIQKTGTITLLK